MRQINFNFLIATILLLILAVLFACKSDSQINADSIIQVTNGQVTGMSGDNNKITVYKGIPYAAPPVGDLRWKAPQTPIPWEGVRPADEFCKSCIQNSSRERLPWTFEYMISNEVSEDCLALNIWTSAKTNTENLPIFVYIHGGGFVEGSGEVPLYNGESLASKEIVVITINYRLGIMGFFAHPELTAESTNNSSGNYGLLDQIAALKWLKQNIAAFGGNPDQITIAGQSAGAQSVHVLNASPLAKDLFQGAIAQSGPWSPQRGMASLEEYEQIGAGFADSLGAKSLAELRSISADELHAKISEYQIRLRPIVDGWLLPDKVESIFASRRQNDVPMITGFNADEASSRSSYGKLTIEEFSTLGKENFGEMYSQFAMLYPSNTEEEAKTNQLIQLRDERFASMHQWSEIRSTGKAKTYNYYFDRATPWPEHPQFKAFHSSEVPYVFDNQHLIDRPWEAMDGEIAEKISAYWVNFITNGNPNGTGLSEWPVAVNKMLRFDESIVSDVTIDNDKWNFYQATWDQLSEQ